VICNGIIAFVRYPKAVSGPGARPGLPFVRVRVRKHLRICAAARPDDGAVIVWETVKSLLSAIRRARFLLRTASHLTPDEARKACALLLTLRGRGRCASKRQSINRAGNTITLTTAPRPP